MITDLAVKITPEGLRVAQTYLVEGNIRATANSLAMSDHEVSDYLQTREVKKYIDHQYLESGYRNRNKIAEALDQVIELKMEEMEESEMGSQKDILELLQAAHKMRMDEIKAMKEDAPKNQTNVMITEAGGKNYNTLLGKIYNGS